MNKGTVRRLLRFILIVTLFMSLNIGLSSSSKADKDVDITYLEKISHISYGSPLKVKVKIENSRDIAITSEDNLNVKLYIDGKWKKSVKVSKLSVGESKTVTLRYGPKQGELSSGRHNYHVKVKINDDMDTLDHKAYYFRVQSSGGDCYQNYFDSCYDGCMDECIRDTIWKWDMKNIELDATLFDYAKLNSKGNGEFEPEAIHPLLLENGELDLLYMKKNFEISCYIEIRYVDYEDTGPDPSGSYTYKESNFKKLKYLPPTKLEYN